MVEDNGKGFNASQITKTKKGMGISSIDKRVAHLEGTRTIESEKIIEKMTKIPEITVASVISGQYGILCKIRCRDTKQAKNIIYKINSIQGVIRTESMISLEESINDKERLFKSIFET